MAGKPQSRYRMSSKQRGGQIVAKVCEFLPAILPGETPCVEPIGYGAASCQMVLLVQMRSGVLVNGVDGEFSSVSHKLSLSKLDVH